MPAQRRAVLVFALFSTSGGAIFGTPARHSSTRWRHDRATLARGMARDVFSVLHFPMLCGVIAMAAATEEALAHPDRPLVLNLRVALGGGAVLFVCGTAAAMWRASGRTLPWRWGLAPAAMAGVLALGAVPWIAMTILLAMLVAVSVIEHQRSASHGLSWRAARSMLSRAPRRLEPARPVFHRLAVRRLRRELLHPVRLPLLHFFTRKD